MRSSDAKLQKILKESQCQQFSGREWGAAITIRCQTNPKANIKVWRTEYVKQIKLMEKEIKELKNQLQESTHNMNEGTENHTEEKMSPFFSSSIELDRT